jgi:hypothetical protein
LLTLGRGRSQSYAVRKPSARGSTVVRLSATASTPAASGIAIRVTAPSAAAVVASITACREIALYSADPSGFRWMAS